MAEVANDGDILGLFLAIGIPLFLTFGPIAFSAIFGSYYQKGRWINYLNGKTNGKRSCK